MFHVEQKIRLAVAKDHLVSGEVFEILLDEERQIAFTKPAPAEDALPAYYQSEEYISHGNKRITFRSGVSEGSRLDVRQKKAGFIDTVAKKKPT